MNDCVNDAGKDAEHSDMTSAAMLVATPKAKHTQQLALLVLFQYRLKRYGARNAPASAP